ncbi:2-hydroxyacyl-CoA dehydratase family protein [Chloroflexota bacterium]
MKKIGITTSVPVEALLAAGYTPVDLNNVFISDPDPQHLIRIAEKDGFPLNCCSWIKGIYGICMESDIDTVICVTGGDCSNTIMIMEVLKLKGLETIAFAYPQQPDVKQMQASIKELAERLGTTLEKANHVWQELEPVRQLAHSLDRLTWREGVVSGFENHLWLVSSSDFNLDYNVYSQQLQELINSCRKRSAYPDDMLRIAYIGVPAVYGREMYNFLEKNVARVVYNEIQRQFSMPEPGNSLAQQYCNYTYPYSIYYRLNDIKAELKRRRVDAIIHYVQAFCHRGIGDIILRDAIELPILTIEGNDDFYLNQHIKTRLEAFTDMLKRSPVRAGQNKKRGV